MLSVFMTASSARGDDERVVRGFGQLPEIVRSTAPHAGDGIGGTAFVDAEPAIDPVDLAAVLFRFAHQRGDRVFWDEMILFLDAATVHRVGVRGLRGERLQYRTLIGEDVDVVAAFGGEIDQPQGRRRTRVFVRRIHDRDRDRLFVGHGVLSQCQMTLAPSARASSTTSSGAAATPEARRFSSMPRSLSEKLSASSFTPAPARLVRSADRGPGRTGRTPFCTRNRVTSFFDAASCRARSPQKRVSFESNGSRDSIKRYLATEPPG